MYYVDKSSIPAECFSYCQQARQYGDRSGRNKRSFDEGVTLFFVANLVVSCVGCENRFTTTLDSMIRTTTPDPSLSSTCVVEDVQNHDEVVGLKLSYTHHECFFTILIFNDVPGPSPQDGSTRLNNQVIGSLLDRFNEACTWTEQDKTVEDVDKRLDPIWQEAEDLVRKAAFNKIKTLSCEYRRKKPSCRGAADKLSDYLFPKAFTLQIVPEDEHFDVVVRPDLPPSLPFAVETDISVRSGLVCVRPQEIIVLEKYRAHILKVRIGTDVFCCKLNNTGAQNSFLRELDILQRLHETSKLDGLRVPQLRGVVAVSDGVVGLLVDLVETEDPDLMTLLNRKTDITDTLRRKWADQISSTLQQCHTLGLVWGDAKTGNVLIDHNQDAWLIDFGGGFTRGWVEEAFYDTQEGDLQGLRNTILDIFGER